MKNLTLKSWNYREELEGLLFFVQRLYELTIDTTDFLEKEVRVSTYEIVKEILDLIRVYEVIKLDSFEKELAHLKEELIHKLKHDEVANNLLGSKKELYLSSLNDQKNIENIRQAMQIALHRLNRKKYLSVSRDLLLNAVNDYKKKDRIANLCDCFFEVLLNGGYQKGTIQHLVNIYFFDRVGTNKIDSYECLGDFLDKFDLKKREYEIIFKGSLIFDEIKESCKRFNIELVENIDVSYGKSYEKKFLKNDNKRFTYIKCTKVSAVDYLHAKKEASDKISLLSDLFVIFHHRKKPWFSDECLIYNHTKEHVIISGKTLNPMAKGKDSSLKDVSSVFNVFIKNFGLESDSFKRFNRSVEIHSLSLENNEVSSQILNLWICLESLLVTGRKGSHLFSVEKPITNIVFNSYLKDRISNLLELLNEWNINKVDEVFSTLPEKLAIDKKIALCSLISCKDYEKQADNILNELNEEPLLRYKFGKLIRIMQSNSNLEEYLSLVKKRIAWDIQRVYRSRNKIVHQGVINDHSELLVETAHYYLDSVIMSIIYKRLIGVSINSVDNLIYEEEMVFMEKQQLLEVIKSSSVNPENIRSLVFGVDGVNN